MSMTRRTASKAGLFGLMTALSGITTGMAKDNKPGGGFGATASVSVNSGNGSGNQSLTYQENQAIITDSGAIALNQGNNSGGTQQQGAVIAADGTTPAAPSNQETCPPMISLNIAVSDSKVQTSDWYVPYRCACNYCQG